MTPARGATSGSAGFEEPGGFEEPDKLDPGGPDILPEDRDEDDPQIGMAPAAAALAVFTVLRGLLPLLDTVTDVPRGLGAVLMLAAGASGLALLVGGALNIWRSWGM